MAVFINRHATMGRTDVFLAGDAAPVENGLVNPIPLACERAIFQGRRGRGGGLLIALRMSGGEMGNGEAKNKASKESVFRNHGFLGFCLGLGSGVDEGAGVGGESSTPQIAALARCR